MQSIVLGEKRLGDHGKCTSSRPLKQRDSAQAINAVISDATLSKKTEENA